MCIGLSGTAERHSGGEAHVGLCERRAKPLSISRVGQDYERAWIGSERSRSDHHHTLWLARELRRSWSIDVDDHESAPRQKQDHFMALRRRRIHITVHEPGGNMEEITLPDIDAVLSPWSTLKPNDARDHVPVDVIVTVVVPAGDVARLDPCPNDEGTFRLEGELPHDTGRPWGC